MEVRFLHNKKYPLRPNKQLNPQFSILNAGGIIIKTLKERGILKFDELLAILSQETDPKIKNIYLPSLSFLFLLGKLQYHKEIDSFELIN